MRSSIFFVESIIYPYKHQDIFRRKTDISNILQNFQDCSTNQFQSSELDFDDNTTS